MGNHPQLGATLLRLLRTLVQPIHLPQHRSNTCSMIPSHSVGNHAGDRSKCGDDILLHRFFTSALLTLDWAAYNPLPPPPESASMMATRYPRSVIFQLSLARRFSLAPWIYQAQGR